MDYRARRQQLASHLPHNSIALISAAREMRRNGDSTYRFCQNSDFYYLTGFDEPDALLLITSEAESILFNRARVLADEQWTGARLGPDGAVQTLDMDQAYPYDDLDSRLSHCLAGKTHWYYAIGSDRVHERMVLRAWRELTRSARAGVTRPQTLVDLAPILGEMRLIKQPEELVCLREAARISVAAHERLIRRTRHLHYEYELEAEFLYEITRQGCRSTAYDTIVAGGERACVLHYTRNDQALCDGELVLVDAGGEFKHYAADITRTFPVNGHFSHEQRCIYALVLAAQRAGIACVQPGALWNSVQQAVVRVLTAGLVELGLLTGDTDELIAREAYKPFYMHSSGHWLGLDVHDAGAYRIAGAWRPLLPGMVLTVEPGLYIAPGSVDVHPRWWGIGVRIEDDLLVTETGHENLTQALPTNPDVIEEWLRD